MRKELFLAIFAGSVLGLILAFGIWRANSVFKQPSKNGKTAITATPAADFKIVIAKPLNNQVLGETPITISGVTKSSAYIVAAGEESDSIATAEKDGKFSVETDLGGGANQIKVFAFEENGSAAEAKLTLVYSTEFAKDGQNSEEDKTATTSDEVRQKVIEKLQDTTKPGVAVYGVVTDITDGTIQIKSQSGEIQQIGFSKDAVFLKSGKTTKTIKSNEVAIGDFIIAMGTKTGNAFAATRILVTDALVDSQMTAQFGKLTVIGKNKLTIKNPKSEEEIIINTDANTTFTALDTKLKIKKMTDLDEGDWVIIIGQNSARTVFVVKSVTPSPTPTSTPKK